MLRSKRFILLLCLLPCLGCSKHSDTWQQAIFPKKISPTNSSAAEVQYQRAEAQSELGSMELYSISDSYLSKRTIEVEGKLVTPLNLQEEFGIDAYLVEGYELPRSVLIAPVVSFRSSFSGEQSAVTDLGGGRLEVKTVITLTDGKNLFGAEKIGRLRSRLRETLNGDPNFIAASQCPDLIEIKDPELGTFKVAFETDLKSCPLGIPFPTKVIFTKDEYEKFRLGFIEGGRAKVNARFNFSTPVTILFGSLSLKHDALFELVSQHTTRRLPTLRQDQVDNILNLVVSGMETSFAEIIPEKLVPELRARLESEFFETRTRPECPNGEVICYSLEKPPLPGALIKMDLVRDEYFGSPVTYVSDNILSDSLGERSPVLLKSDSIDVLNPPTQATVSDTLRTIMDGDIVELRFNSLKQTEFEFQEPMVRNISNQVCTAPYSQCLAGSWKCTNPDSENYNCRNVCSGGWQNVCVSSHEVCTVRDWSEETHSFVCLAYGTACDSFQNQCRGFTKVCDQRSRCESLDDPDLPLLPYRIGAVTLTDPDYAWTCTSQADNVCDKGDIKDEWQRITTFSLPFPRPDLVERPMETSDLNEVMAGIKFQFSDGVACDVSAFNPKLLSPTRVMLTFKNSDACHPFLNTSGSAKARSDQNPSLSFSNFISLPQRFRCGEISENYLGDRIYKCVLPGGEVITKVSSVVQDAVSRSAGAEVGIVIPFYPKTEISAELRFVGGYFESLPKETK